MTLSENAAYLKGLAEGMGMDENSANSKVLVKLLDLISEMAETIEDLQNECDRLNEYADELDADLGDVEQYLFSDDEDDDDEEDDDAFEVTCPSCGEVICFDASCDPSELICPACGEEFDCICCGDDCEGCDCCDSEEE